MEEQALTRLVPVVGTKTYRVEDHCICVCQPTTGEEILLTGVARRIWEEVENGHHETLADLLAALAREGGVAERVERVAMELVRLRLLELQEVTGW